MIKKTTCICNNCTVQLYNCNYITLLIIWLILYQANPIESNLIIHTVHIIRSYTMCIIFGCIFLINTTTTTNIHCDCDWTLSAISTISICSVSLCWNVVIFAPRGNMSRIYYFVNVLLS